MFSAISGLWWLYKNRNTVEGAIKVFTTAQQRLDGIADKHIKKAEKTTAKVNDLTSVIDTATAKAAEAKALAERIGKLVNG